MKASVVRTMGRPAHLRLKFASTWPRVMVLVPATAFMGVAVEVFARAGEVDAAFEMLELLLAMPAGREATVAFLRVWPGFDPIRGDARFEQLLARFAPTGYVRARDRSIARGTTSTSISVRALESMDLRDPDFSNSRALTP